MEPKSRKWLSSVVPGHGVRVTERTARICPPGQAGKATEPEIILIREGDVVKAIEVICTCGQRTRLNCVF